MTSNKKSASSSRPLLTTNHGFTRLNFSSKNFGGFTILRRSSGFTIVELIVAIVIIGVLATITIVSYVGIQQRATVAVLKSDLVNSTQALKLYQVEHSAYPTAIDDCTNPTPATENMCLKSSPNNVYTSDYQAINNTNPQTFCLSAKSANNTKYHITEDSVPELGICPFSPETAFASNPNVTSTSIHLTWEAVTDAASYTIQISTSPNFATILSTNTIPSQTGVEPSIDLTSLTPMTDYYYRVNALTTDGDTSEWAVGEKVTTAPTTPLAPVVSVDDTATDTSTWSWPAVTCALGSTTRYQYRYTINTTPTAFDSGWEEPNDPAALSIPFTTSSEGYTYTVSIQSQCYTETTTSEWSTSNIGSSAGYYRPITVPILTATVASSSAIDLSWTAITGATSYTLQQDTTSAFTTATTIATIIPPAATTYPSTGLSTGTTYYYRVNKTSAGGTSDWSSTKNATTTITAPSAPTVTANTVTTTTTWSWPGVTCASGTTARYQYDYLIDSTSQAPSGWKTPTNPAALSIDFTTSTEGHTYSVEVQAQCFVGSNASDWSSTSGKVDYYRQITLTAIAAISGTTTAIGNTLTAGALTPSGATVTYQWQSATTSGGSYTNISSATASTYTIVLGNVGKYIKIVATATGIYTGTQTSAASAVVSDSNWLAVGNQVWAKYNLNVGTMVTGVTTQTNNSILEKYCFDDTESNCTSGGGLYSWDEAMQYVTTEGAQGICPVGSHIPSDNDWKILEMQLGMTQAQADATSWRGTDQGTQLKSGGTSGLNMPLTGYRGGTFPVGSFLSQTGTVLWSSSESSAVAWRRILDSGNAAVRRDSGAKANGCSVRCLGN